MMFPIRRKMLMNSVIINVIPTKLRKSFFVGYFIMLSVMTNNDLEGLTYNVFCIFCFHRANWHSPATLTEVSPCFFLRCKANARV